MKIQLPSSDPRQRTPLFQQPNADGTPSSVFVWGRWEAIDFPRSDEDEYHTIAEKDVGCFDRLADEFYGDPRLFWVLLRANAIFNSMTVEVGLVIRVPARRHVLARIAGKLVDSAGIQSPSPLDRPLGVSNTFSSGFVT